MLLQGFSAGIPLALTGTTLQAWMKDQHIDITVIGLFSLVGLPYAFKFVWSPLLDRFSLPWLGHRRGWLLVAQLILAAAIAGMGLCSPAAAPGVLGLMALIVAFASASQDILIDAYRVESLPSEEYGAGLSIYTLGYRLAMITSGAVALSMADHLPWRTVYLAMAGTMGVGILTTAFIREPRVEASPPRSFHESVVEPVLEFLVRPGAVEVLLFLTIYKLDTNLSVALMTPFFLDLGFTKTDVAATTKVFGMIALIVGALAAGAVMTRWTILRALVIFGVLQAIASVSFMWLAHFGKSAPVTIFNVPIYPSLVAAVGAENFFSGMGVAAQGAFMMTLVNKRYTATQYALITSFMALSRYVANAPAGFLVRAVGWEKYYLVCAVVGVPGLLLLLRYRSWTLPSASEPIPQPVVEETAALAE